MRRLGLMTIMLALGAGIFFAAYKARHMVPPPVAEKLGLRADISEIRAHQIPILTSQLAHSDLSFSAPVFIRIFKEEAELEVWIEDDSQFSLFKTYPICNFSGDLGPKLREGDRQSPEGIYNVTRDALNPNSSFHLSFNLGFPNRFDRSHDRTGSFLMVHGNCVSVGCYAMTDPMIEEIYVLVEAALSGGQHAVPVHAFPFRMTPERMAQAAHSPWFGFWEQLSTIYEQFETTRQIPTVEVIDGRYAVN